MKKLIVAFASVTFANKAKAVFNKKGLTVQVGRTPKNVSGGCGYSIYIAADPTFVIKTLEDHKIPYKSIGEDN